MSDAWKKRKTALEEDYFRKQEEEALRKLAGEKIEEKQKKISPITGELMDQIEFHGVEIDMCKTSGGVWLDKGELEKIIDNIKKEAASEQSSWLDGFLSKIKI